MFSASPPASRSRAFSLVELIAVMAILVIMLSLLAPAIGSFTSGASRNGAVNILMNTMEQARVAALESGRTVYIVFNRRVFPEQDRLMVLREPDPAATEKTEYDQLTRWIKLPKGILLHTLDGKKVDILSEGMPSSAGDTGFSFDPKKSPTPLDVQGGEQMNLLAFNPYGGVAFPNSSKLMLIVSEGVRDSSGSEAMISNNKQKAGGFEIITLRRYTGRASLEVTTL